MKNLIALLLFILVASCGKERTIQILAKNAATGEAYGGLHYVVGYSTTTGSGEKSHTVHSGNLDENGSATVAVRVKRNRTYYVHVDEPENTCYNKFITMYFNSPFDEDGHFNFEFAPCATMQRIVKNINCIDATDKIEIVTDNNMHSLASNPWILNGCANYSTVPTKFPAGEYYLHWTVTKNSSVTEFSDTFTLSENESKIYEIDY